MKVTFEIPKKEWEKFKEENPYETNTQALRQALQNQIFLWNIDSRSEILIKEPGKSLSRVKFP